MCVRPTTLGDGAPCRPVEEVHGVLQAGVRCRGGEGRHRGWIGRAGVHAELALGRPPSADIGLRTRARERATSTTVWRTESVREPFRQSSPPPALCRPRMTLTPLQMTAPEVGQGARRRPVATAVPPSGPAWSGEARIGPAARLALGSCRVSGSRSSRCEPAATASSALPSPRGFSAFPARAPRHALARPPATTRSDGPNWPIPRRPVISAVFMASVATARSGASWHPRGGDGGICRRRLC